MNNYGFMYVVAAPSGGGKTRLVRALLADDPSIKVSISCTTRPPRPQDEDGVDYFFKSEQEFAQMIEAKSFVEHAEVFGHRYGTSHEWIVQQLERGIDIILEIDWQGARQVKQIFSQVITIFILPPSLDILQQRLQGRNQDTPEVIEQRMNKAQSEIEHYYEFDYLLVNDDFDTLLQNATHIIGSQRLRSDRQDKNLSSLLEDLLKNH